MDKSLEQRVEELEKKVAELEERIQAQPLKDIIEAFETLKKITLKS